MSKDGPPEELPRGKEVALIAGPTASGKSDLAVRLARHLEDRGRRAVVINADSAQVYADLAVLSARPGREEMGGIEHRLFGAWDGSQACSAADWALAARREITTLHAEDAVPILAGGTGLYLRVLLDGIAEIPAIDPTVRTEVRNLTTSEAHDALRVEDPARAARLAANDGQRIARALEVVRSTGRTLGEWQTRASGGLAEEVALQPLILLPDREWLYERCDRRFETMMDSGAVEEVEALLARDLDPNLPVMRAIGVREIAGWIGGSITLSEAIAAAQLSTRHYVKRQLTWFRNQTPSGWHEFGNEQSLLPDRFATLFA